MPLFFWGKFDQSRWSYYTFSFVNLVKSKWFFHLNTLIRGENEELRVGVRRLMRQQNNMPSSVISSHSMHLGVLATASHAISTGTLFSVFYKPRSSFTYFTPRDTCLCTFLVIMVGVGMFWLAYLKWTWSIISKRFIFYLFFLGNDINIMLFVIFVMCFELR